MSFSERDKTKALAIVKIFETSKPFGDYTAVAVLDDGAGISYGTSQFTHNSGSLGAVLKRFQDLGGTLPANLEDAYPDIKAKRNVNQTAGRTAVKNELKALGKTALMQRAQREIAFENYLKPALKACEGSDFESPLSLAVIYDSINQGGYARVRDKVTFTGPGNGSIKPEEFEREWISEYCRRRVTYLKGLRSSAAKASVYRPNFFLAQIKAGNWDLKLPMTVHGHRLTEAILFPKVSADAKPIQSDEPEIITEGSTLDDQTGIPSVPQGEAPPTQFAENITNVKTGDQNLPDDFVPENKTITAPEPSGILGRGKAWLIGLGVGVPSVGGLFESIKGLAADGSFSVRDVFAASKEIFVFLLPYLFWFGIAFVVFWGIKELLKQASFMLNQYTLARGDMHNVAVIPNEPKAPVAGAWRFAPLAAFRSQPPSITAVVDGDKVQ